MIRGKTPDEIRIAFDIVNDFTPEEEAQVICIYFYHGVLYC